MDFIQALHAQGKKAHAEFNWLLVLGIFNIILGFFALAFAYLATMVMMLYLGWLFIFSGVATLYFAFRLRKIGGHWSYALFGTLAIVCGVFMLVHPMRNAEILTLIAGVFVFTSGLFSIVACFFSQFPHRVSMAFSGVVSLICAYIIYAEWPFSGTWVLGTFVGVYLIIHGFTQMQIGAAGKRLMASGRSSRPAKPSGRAKPSKA